jgi:hypothetical protein
MIAMKCTNIIIVIITTTTYMQGMYNYTPETIHVSRVYSIAAVVYLQFVLYVMLFCKLNMFCTFTVALAAVCMQCPV